MTERRTPAALSFQFDQQHRHAVASRQPGQRRTHGRLADPAFARDDQDRAL